jgi:uncharacterized membrane protein YagU involved in acid resistance
MPGVTSEGHVQQQGSNSTARYLRRGVIAGLIGGLAFGSIMAFIGMLPMVGMLIRQNNALIGFGVHMVISAVIGAVIGAGFGRLIAVQAINRPAITLTVGALYGLFWWFLGAMLLMPLLLGMPEQIFVVGQMQIESLVGHLIYGVVVGIVINALPD